MADPGAQPPRPQPPHPRRRAILPLAFTAGALGLSLLATSTQGWGIPCFFHALTSLPCASCGMTRAFLALGHGRVGEALDLHLASPGVYLAAWTILGLSLAQLLSGRELLRPVWIRVKGALVPSILIVMALAWGLNLRRRFAEPKAAPCAQTQESCASQGAAPCLR